MRDGGIINFEKRESLQIIDPHGQRIRFEEAAIALLTLLERSIRLRELSRSPFHALFEAGVRLPQLFFGALLILDVSARAEPLQDFAFGIAQRNGPPEMPAVGAVRSTLEAVFHFVFVTSRKCFRPTVDAILQVVRMQDRLP
ncbi:MAG: hypothetical protein M3Q86_12330, partial [Verrucomicrobiota bacterium]|nr:hypothetical protein [Verrucomicrobiota bacterium]